MGNKIEIYTMMYGDLADNQLRQIEDSYYSRDGQVAVKDIVGRIYASIIEIKRMVLDRTANESFYTREQIEVIDDVCNRMVEDLQENRISEAINRLMCLQLLLDVQISLVSYIKKLLTNEISLEQYVDINKFNGRNNNENDIGHGRYK